MAANLCPCITPQSLFSSHHRIINLWTVSYQISQNKPLQDDTRPPNHLYFVIMTSSLYVVPYFLQIERNVNAFCSPACINVSVPFRFTLPAIRGILHIRYVKYPQNDHMLSLSSSLSFSRSSSLLSFSISFRLSLSIFLYSG